MKNVTIVRRRKSIILNNFLRSTWIHSIRREWNVGVLDWPVDMVCLQMFLLAATVQLLNVLIQSSTAQSLTYSMKRSHWKAKKDQMGNALCSIDAPTVKTTVRSRIHFQQLCSSSNNGCWNYNFKDELGQRCELFYRQPVNFTTGVPSCQHFEVCLSLTVSLVVFINIALCNSNEVTTSHTSNPQLVSVCVECMN
jgi:hypothetical protein